MLSRSFPLAVALTVLSLASAASARADDVTVPFAYTGAEQSFVVPAGVDAVRVVAIGGHGGRGWTTSFHGSYVSQGGEGARVEATVPVTPRQTLVVTVGGNGVEQIKGAAFGGGGAAGVVSGDFAGGGGGASDIRTCPTVSCALTGDAADPRLLVAGGGGGGGASFLSTGGAGGDAGVIPRPGTSGADYAGPGSGGGGGGGATDAAGGTGGAAGFSELPANTSVGAPGTAGHGGDSQTTRDTSENGGGGGGGWFGGGSGGNGGWVQGDTGGGGGGGAGASHLAAGAYNVTVVADTTATPSVTIAYTPDTTPPRVDVASPADGATYIAGQSVTASYACTDPAGVTQCSGDVASGAAVDTSVGEHSFTVAATDAAGNAVSRTLHYAVAAALPATLPVAPPPAQVAPPATVHAPVLRVSASKRSLATVISSRAVLVSVTCDVGCDATGTAELGATAAGSGRATLTAARPAQLRVKLTTAIVRKLRGRRSATFAVTVRARASGLTASKTLHVTFRR